MPGSSPRFLAKARDLPSDEVFLDLEDAGGPGGQTRRPAGGGGYTGGDAYHYARMRILVAARSRGLAAIDGPCLAVHDTGGLRRAAASVAALGYDGKWVLHPGQVDIVNQVFTPDQDSYDRAELILDAYAEATTVSHRGAVMLGDEMIDEASRQLALVTAAKGRAAGLSRSPAGPGSAEHPPRGERFSQAAGQD